MRTAQDSQYIVNDCDSQFPDFSDIHEHQGIIYQEYEEPQEVEENLIAALQRTCVKQHKKYINQQSIFAQNFLKQIKSLPPISAIEYDNRQISVNLKEETQQFQFYVQCALTPQLDVQDGESKQYMHMYYEKRKVETNQSNQQIFILNKSISTQCSSNPSDKTDIQSSQSTELINENIKNPINFRQIQSYQNESTEEQEKNDLYMQLNIDSLYERLNSIHNDSYQIKQHNQAQINEYLQLLNQLVVLLKKKNIQLNQFKKDNNLLLKLQLANCDFSYQNKFFNELQPQSKNIICNLKFECICGKKYKEQSTLLNHQKNAHNLKEYNWLFQSLIPSRTGRGSCFNVYQDEYKNMFKNDLWKQKKNNNQIEFQNYHYYIDDLIKYINDNY
ncbi:hypothetical protein ABPG74_012872 [Tetrahymena malaccensis]